MISRIREDGEPEDRCVICWFVRNMTYVGHPERKRYKCNKILKKDLLTKLSEKKNFNTYRYLFFYIITTFLKAFVLPGYAFLYSDVIELCHLRTQQWLRFSPLHFHKISGWPHVSLNVKTKANRWKRCLGCERDCLKLPSGNSATTAALLSRCAPSHCRAVSKHYVSSFLVFCFQLHV